MISQTQCSPLLRIQSNLSREGSATILRIEERLSTYLPSLEELEQQLYELIFMYYELRKIAVNGSKSLFNGFNLVLKYKS